MDFRCGVGPGQGSAYAAARAGDQNRAGVLHSCNVPSSIVRT
jgi:hypothetical protein